MEIINYEELPKAGSLIRWSNIKQGFIIKVRHETYGYNEFELVSYEKSKHRLFLKYEDIVSEITTGHFSEGRIGKLLIEYKEYISDNFNIMTKLPTSKLGICWNRIENGMIFKTYHKKYGHNDFKLIKYDSKDTFLHLEYKNNECIPISIGNFIKGKISSLVENMSSISGENFNIITKLPQNKRRIMWEKLNYGTIIKTEHSNYGNNDFEFVKYCDGLLYLKFNNNCSPISVDSFKFGNIGKLIGKITREFRFNIGEHINDEKRSLIIIDKKYIKTKYGQDKKYYRYKCNKCGFDCGEHFRVGEFKEDLWIEEFHLLEGNGCSCCCKPSQIVATEINSIWKTDDWMIELGMNEQDAKRFTKGTHNSVIVQCPHCKVYKNIKVEDIYTSKSIGCTCNVGTYPEKFIYYLLKQLGVKFETQYNPKWIKRRFYDFFIPNSSTIIETHGIQHYENSNRGRSLEEEQINDELKEKASKENGIKNYIVIDCRYSELDFIKNNILNSKLSELFDLSEMKWDDCELFAIKSNNVKEVCDYWNSKEEYETTSNLAEIFNKNIGTIAECLKKGTKLGWCNYNPKEEKAKTLFKKGQESSRKKKVEVIKDGVSLGVFDSIIELEKYSEELFGLKFDNGRMSSVCLGKAKQHKGYTFKHFNEIREVSF